MILNFLALKKLGSCEDMRDKSLNTLVLCIFFCFQIATLYSAGVIYALVSAYKPILATLPIKACIYIL